MEYSRLPFLFCLSAVWMLANAGTPAPAGGRPGCQRRCGDVDIPFPFGIDSDGPQCSIDGFQLSCNTTVDGAHKPFSGNVEVTKISVPDGKAWMRMTIAMQWYDPSTNSMMYSGASLNITDTLFRLSEVDNILVVIGCNTLAYLQSDSYVIGCLSTCDNDTIPKNGSCSGAGCCQAVVPKGIQYYNAYFNSDYNTTEIWRRSPSGYMALMETAAFDFNTTYLTSTVFNDTYGGEAPVVMDWVITLDTCEKAKRNTTSYACVSSNSQCVDSSDGRGSRCSCSKGYEGLFKKKKDTKATHTSTMDAKCGGLISDIDECLDNATYPCPGICENTVGSFACSCHPGYYMMNGVCMPNRKSAFPAVPFVGASVGLVILAITITCAYLIQERRKLQRIKQKYFHRHGGLLLFEEMKSQQGLAFKIFLEEELQQATNRFDEQQVLGHGGHGTVYKGHLKGNVEVAVKRCKTIDEQQKKEFGKEMLILSQINHKNIVKLLGCCLEVEVPMLVYEFIPNGTLFQLIHGNHGRRISLATRLRVAHESAEALAYLHSWASPPILHGDVKSSNILLDGDYTAKVSDFGASILAPTDESQFVTVVQGTCGYLDPEYMQTYQLTDKSDVYSFGVVLLELLTGKKAFNLIAPEHEKSLSMRFLSAMKENKLDDILDDQIKNDENMEFLGEIAELAKQCLEMCGENRPTMKDVAEKLDRLRKVMQHPWAQPSPEEMESLLGESSSMVSSVVVTTGNFSIEKKAVKGLESGR